MKHITTLLPITSILSIALLAGCTTTQTATTNTNEVTDNANNTTVVSETNSNKNTSNTNEAIEVAENTNSDETISDQVDTSDEVLRSPEDVADWLTYTNEEYGFSFKYPGDWDFEVLKEGGLGTDVDDIRLDNLDCNILITVPHEKDNQERAFSLFKDSLESGFYGTKDNLGCIKISDTILSTFQINS